MLPRHHPGRVQITFDGHRLAANAGLILPGTLALRLGLPQPLRKRLGKRLDPGDAPGRANTGDRLMTLAASALAGGDCIGGADALRAGGTARVPGFTAKAPSTLGAFLRSFRWGHVRQPDRVSRELPARARAAGDGPGGAPFTIDLDSTVCETCGLAKEGARHHGCTGARGYHPLPAIAAGTGEVLRSRLGEGRANTARGAAHFLRETVSRVRYGGASGRLTVRADSGFYTHAVAAACRNLKVRFSIIIGQHASLRNLIEEIPGEDWTPVPCRDGRRRCRGRNHLYPLSGRAGRRAGAAHRPAGEARRPAPSRPSSPPAAITASSPAGTERPWNWRGTGGRPPPPRRDRERHSRPQARRRPEPHALGALRRQRRLARSTGDGPQPGPLDRAHRPGGGSGDHQDPPAPTLLLGRTAHPQGPPPHTASPQGLALGNPVPLCPGAVAGHSTPGLTPPDATNLPINQLNVPANSAPTRSARVLC